MSAAGSRELIAELVRQAISSGTPTSFSVIDTDAANWLDRQGHAVLVRRDWPSEDTIIPRRRR